MTWVVYLAARLMSVACAAVLVALVVFDAQAERFTAGKPPAELRARLEPGLLPSYAGVIGIAHNAGDAVRSATEAAAYGVDGIEIDVRGAGSELYASHDAPLAFLEDLVFRGPSLQRAWDIAGLRPTVLLHLKEHGRTYLAAVHAFLAAHPRRHVIVQSARPATLDAVGRSDPRVQRLLLIFTPAELTALRRDRALLRRLDGVSVRESALGAGDVAWLRRRGLRVFAWTVDDERRMNELVLQGVDGLITERLDIMRLLGGRRAGAR